MLHAAGVFLQRQTRLIVTVIFVLFLLKIALHAGTGAASGIVTQGIVTQYNRRSLGTVGWRRVDMVMSAHGKISRRFQVVNVWDQAGSESRMLYYLEGPDGLTGSRYLQLESSDAVHPLQVYLFLPTSNRVLAIAEDQFDEGLLGSDFTYNDLRFTLPLPTVERAEIGRKVISGQPAAMVERRRSPQPDEEHGNWTRAVDYITLDRPFVIGTDYFQTLESGSERLVKQMRVESFRDVGNVRVAELMQMQTQDGRETSIRLKEISLNLHPTSREAFIPVNLPRLDGYLRQGWPLSQAGRSR